MDREGFLNRKRDASGARGLPFLRLDVRSFLALHKADMGHFYVGLAS